MLATFRAAMTHGDDPGVLHVYGNYVLNILGDDALTMRVWQRASDLSPNEPEYRASVIKLLIAQGRYDEARARIAQLRTLGSLGQHASRADTLDARLQNAMRDNGVRLRQP
jgi:Tfp pilus assembly protein PilF